VIVGGGGSRGAALLAAAGVAAVAGDGDDSNAWIAINLHNAGAAFEPRVAAHLAAGRLVVSEPFTPRHGLEPGIDYVEFRGSRELGRIVAAARTDPRPWQWARVRGRAKAEHFRASRVWPRVIADLLADVRAFGAPTG
jgi:hypothetical protein